MSSGRWSGSNRSERLPADWHTHIRPMVFAVYGDICHWCRQPGADTVDHVEHGDDHRIENLRPIHDDPCHKIKTQQEATAAKRRRAANRRFEDEPHPGLM